MCCGAEALKVRRRGKRFSIFRRQNTEPVAKGIQQFLLSSFGILPIGSLTPQRLRSISKRSQRSFASSENVFPFINALSLLPLFLPENTVPFPSSCTFLSLQPTDPSSHCEIELLGGSACFSSWQFFLQCFVRPKPLLLRGLS